MSTSVPPPCYRDQERLRSRMEVRVGVRGSDVYLGEDGRLLALLPTAVSHILLTCMQRLKSNTCVPRRRKVHLTAPKDLHSSTKLVGKSVDTETWHSLGRHILDRHTGQLPTWKAGNHRPHANPFHRHVLTHAHTFVDSRIHPHSPREPLCPAFLSPSLQGLATREATLG